MTRRSPVLAVDDYYDGIREGSTVLNGVEYRFKSRRLDVTEYSGDYESVDLFDLFPMNSANSLPLVAKAVFFVLEASGTQCNEREFEVEWDILA